MGLHNTQIYWFKKFTLAHERLIQHLNDIITEPTSMFARATPNFWWIVEKFAEAICMKFGVNKC